MKRQFVILTDLKQGTFMSHPGCHTGEKLGLVRRGERDREPWARNLYMISVGRNWQGRICRYRID